MFAPLLLLVLVGLSSAQVPAPSPELLDVDSFSVVANFFLPIIPNLPKWKVPALLHFTWSFSLVTFDSWSYYHPTADGLVVDTDAGRRPANERTVNNKNVAIATALYHLIINWYPPLEEVLTPVMEGFGLDPDEKPSSRTTAVGVGYNVAMDILDYTLNDGMNRGGDYRRTANFRPYEDYTNYRPVNEPWGPGMDMSRFDPSRYTPNIVSTAFQGTFWSEVHVGAQLPWRARFLPDDLDDYVADRSPFNYTDQKEQYIDQVDELIEFSRTLTEERKLLAEFFDDKIASIGFPSVYECTKNECTLDEFVIYDMGRDLSTLEALTVVWWIKRNNDYIRPQTAVPFVYGDKTISAWGGPGRGTRSFPAIDWVSYLFTDSHSEFPSGTICLCRSFGAFSRKFFGETLTGDFGFTQTWAPGSSVVEPGVTPAETLSITFDTWQEFETDCGNSRLWGGVHFQQSIEAMEEQCYGIGEDVYDEIMKFVAGTANRKLQRVPKPGREGLAIGNVVGPAVWDVPCEECDVCDAGFATLPALFLSLVVFLGTLIQ